MSHLKDDIEDLCSYIHRRLPIVVMVGWHYGNDDSIYGTVCVRTIDSDDTATRDALQSAQFSLIARDFALSMPVVLGRAYNRTLKSIEARANLYLFTIDEYNRGYGYIHSKPPTDNKLNAKDRLADASAILGLMHLQRKYKICQPAKRLGEFNLTRKKRCL